MPVLAPIPGHIKPPCSWTFNLHCSDISSTCNIADQHREENTGPRDSKPNPSFLSAFNPVPTWSQSRVSKKKHLKTATENFKNLHSNLRWNADIHWHHKKKGKSTYFWSNSSIHNYNVLVFALAVKITEILSKQMPVNDTKRYSANELSLSYTSD